MKNIKIFILEQSIKKIIQESDLPIGIVYFVLKNIYYSIEDLYLSQIQQEYLQQQKQKEENSSQTSQD